MSFFYVVQAVAYAFNLTTIGILMLKHVMLSMTDYLVPETRFNLKLCYKIPSQCAELFIPKMDNQAKLCKLHHYF